MPPKPPVEHLELGLFGHSRQLVTIQEVAAKFMVSDQQVRNWAQEGWLCTIYIGSDLNKKDSESDKEKLERNHFRIHRFSAEALMVYRTELSNNGFCLTYKLSAETAAWLEKIREFKTLGKKLKG